MQQLDALKPSAPHDAHGRTIVSLTPLPLERDSRTLKIAASFARLGYRSVVVEARPSGSPPKGLGIELITLGQNHAAGADSDWIGRAKTAGRKAALPRWLAERIHLLAFLAAYHVIRPAQGIRQIPPADLYYLHEYRLGPLVRRLRGRAPAPLIYDAHDFYPAVEPDDSLSRFQVRRLKPVLESLERAAIKDAAAVVTVSDGVAGLFEDYYGVRPVVIRNAHDDRLDRSPQYDVRTACGVTPSDFLIVAVGNRKEGQGDKALLAALARLPGTVHVAFVGRFYDGIMTEAASFGVADRVHAVGAVAPEAIVRFIASADLGAVLYFAQTENYAHALPNRFFQTVAAHLPLLYPPLPDIVAAVDGAAIGRPVDPTNPDALESAIRWLRDDAAQRAACRVASRTLAQRLSWAHEETRLADLVQSVLATAAAR